MKSEITSSGIGSAGELVDPRSFYVHPTPAQRLAKPIPAEQVEAVVANRPMPGIPRSFDPVENAARLTHDLLLRVFPQYEGIVTEEGPNADFDKSVSELIADHRQLSMESQAMRTKEHAALFKGLYQLMKQDEALLRPDTFIPIRYLPDLFMAVPVWYFHVDRTTQEQARYNQASPDPQVHPILEYMCQLVPGNRWSDTFLMFNRRMRTLADYQGDIIPPHIARRMKEMAPLFDFLVIMTPYHDVAGKDWENLQWLRSIDPYVIGFKKGVPLMFMLGRFSDSGTFPLYSELVADTIAFLRANVGKLNGFNQVRSPFWYTDGNPATGVSQLGSRLIENTRKLLAAFDAGHLFEWLRNEPLPPAINA